MKKKNAKRIAKYLTREIGRSIFLEGRESSTDPQLLEIKLFLGGKEIDPEKITDAGTHLLAVHLCDKLLKILTSFPEDENFPEDDDPFLDDAEEGRPIPAEAPTLPPEGQENVTG